MTSHGDGHARSYRSDTYDSQSSISGAETVPFLLDHSNKQSPVLEPSDLERCERVDDDDKILSQPLARPSSDDDYGFLIDTHTPIHPHSKWTWRLRIPQLFSRLLGRRRRSQRIAAEKSSFRRRRPTLLRRTLRLIALLLMIVGLFQFISLLCGLYISFFPDELVWPDTTLPMSDDFDSKLGHWPTDATADIAPVACVSHNDYWRKQPLFSALNAGCVGVEADVWLYNDDLYVGHSTASLTPTRTLRTLYVDPLMNILQKQNPQSSFHPKLDTPRNGVFDTSPKQTLILLIDFKTDGEQLWPYVYEQLAPLRNANYLAHWDGKKNVPGPITVVVTGNAPWNKVVSNTTYRDMFFDSPLDLMANVATDTSAELNTDSRESFSLEKEKAASITESNDNKGGQGRSGNAPNDAMAYSAANSFYASVNFKSSILQFPLPFPWRPRLTKNQLDLIRAQIAGAHARGLKVRYWGVPDWPKGVREYLWRTLVREGVDFLNVDDLKEATTGDWARRWEQGDRGWWWWSR